MVQILDEGLRSLFERAGLPNKVAILGQYWERCCKNFALSLASELASSSGDNSRGNPAQVRDA